MTFHRNEPYECGLTPQTKILLRNRKEGKTIPFNEAAYSLTPPKKKIVPPLTLPRPEPLEITDLETFRKHLDTQAKEWINKHKKKPLEPCKVIRFYDDQNKPVNMETIKLSQLLHVLSPSPST